MENKILVLYVGVALVRTADIPNYVQEVVKRIMPDTFNGEIITIPIQSVDSRIECINPKYITKKELIKEHTEMIEKLRIELNYQAAQLKEKQL